VWIGRSESSMGSEDVTTGLVGADQRAVYRLGGISAIVLGLSYLVITGLYLVAGIVPTGVEDWLEYLAGQTTVWWGIVGLSVLTDLLFVPLAIALYRALEQVNRNAMQVGVSFLLLFVVLDLAVTWPNYASLIALSGEYAAATVNTQRAAYVAAANYPSSVLESTLFAAYVILVPALGILLIGLVMLKGAFGRIAAYLGVATGIAGIIAVVGPIFSEALDVTVVLTAVLTTVWVLAVGSRLVALARR
jgi:hypothetical protein